MDRQQEQKLKAMAQEMNDCAKGTATPYGAALAGSMIDTAEPCRASLRERVSSQLYRAERESYKAIHLRELNDLLDKNPELARILDLIEEVR